MIYRRKTLDADGRTHGHTDTDTDETRHRVASSSWTRLKTDSIFGLWAALVPLGAQGGQAQQTNSNMSLILEIFKVSRGLI